MNNSIQNSAPPFDLVDNVFNLAYWMTGDEATAGMLVSQTFLSPDAMTTRPSVFKAFRTVYLRSFGQNAELSADVSRIDDGEVARAVVSLPADFKMVVLLADVEGIPHREIADIVGKPLDTVRSWLHWGRKLLFKELSESVQN